MKVNRTVEVRPREVSAQAMVKRLLQDFPGVDLVLCISLSLSSLSPSFILLSCLLTIHFLA
jgi:hypothetical protein